MTLRRQYVLPAPGRPVIPILSASPMPPTRRQKYALRYKRVFISVASGGELDSWRTKVIHFPTNGGWGLGWGHHLVLVSVCALRGDTGASGRYLYVAMR